MREQPPSAVRRAELDSFSIFTSASLAKNQSEHNSENTSWSVV
jgi:hypothetical protein